MGWIADLLSEIPSAARYKIQLEQMEVELVACKTKVGILESKVLAAEEKIRLNDEENKKKLDDSHGQRLEEIREKILIVVSQQEGLHDTQIAELANLGKQLTTLHLHELREAKFVRSGFGLDDNSYEVDIWFIEQHGRKYLSHHGLL